MTRFADLHLHTYHSDGTRSPREVIDLARERGLDIVAISDHDNIAAYFEVKRYADERGVILIAATELSCGYDGVDVHILAYAFNTFDERIDERLRRFRDVRHRRGYAIVEKLRQLGYDISPERVEQLAAGGAMGRPHVARALVESGRVASISEAFNQLLGSGKPAYVEGYDRADWILLDYFDFIVHVFGPETRVFYDLERLWGNAERIEVP